MKSILSFVILAVVSAASISAAGLSIRQSIPTPPSLPLNSSAPTGVPVNTTLPTGNTTAPSVPVNTSLPKAGIPSLPSLPTPLTPPTGVPGVPTIPDSPGPESIPIERAYTGYGRQVPIPPGAIPTHPGVVLPPITPPNGTNATSPVNRTSPPLT